MCGIIGYVAPNTVGTRQLLAKLLMESSYRGRHSMGIAWTFNGEFYQHMLNLEFGLFELELDLELCFCGLDDLRVIGHTRYCTSDPETPLPLIESDMAIVLNGVISQEPPETWEQYGAGPYSTGNDAEIMLRLALLCRVEQTPGSYAACLLEDTGTIMGVRSPERPMWWHSWLVDETDVAYVFTSTLDIAIRAGGDRKTSREVIPGVGVCLNEAAEVARWNTYPDLQKPHKKVPPCKL